MTKRGKSFKRSKRDLYLTPPEAVLPLLPHLPHYTRFFEPCAANGGLADILKGHGFKCTGMADIAPLRADVVKADCTNPDQVIPQHFTTHFITNPPWTRSVLHQIIPLLAASRPTWLLFDADWAYTEQAMPFMLYCQKIVCVGRVSWMGNGVTGFDNAAWYLFDKTIPHECNGGLRQFVEAMKKQEPCVGRTSTGEAL